MKELQKIVRNQVESEQKQRKKKKLQPCMLSTGLVFRNEAAGLAEIKPRRLEQLIKQLATPHL